MITREILEHAARHYDGDKYPEKFYTYNLDLLQEVQEISEVVGTAVRHLFLWKLGKVRSNRTPKSFQLAIPDSIGKYYSARTTKTHHEVIEKATKKEMLKAAISFRDGILGYHDFKPYAAKLTSSTIVLPAFYVHIWRPFEYPILDEKVWKVFCHEKGRSVARYTKPRSWSDYETYKNFFTGIVNSTTLDWRTVDKGLWVLGDLLKTRRQTLRTPNRLHHGDRQFKMTKEVWTL